MKRLRLTGFSATASALVALVLAAPAVAQGKAPADAIERSDRARSLFKQGLDALASRKYEVARSHLLEAFKLSPSYDVAGALGQAEIQLGRHRDAAEHLELSLRNFPPSESLQLRKRVSDGLDAAKKRVAALRLTLVPGDAELRVDGARISTAPIVFVEAGSHEIEARLPTGETDAVTFSGVVGTEQSVSLAPHRKEEVPAAVTPAAAGVAPAAASETPRAPPASDVPSSSGGVAPKTWVLVGGGVVTAVLAGVGVVQVVRAGNADEDASSLRRRANEELGQNCPTSSSNATCQQLFRALDRRNSANQTVPYLFAGAGIAAAATAAIYYWMSTEEVPANRAARLDVSLLPHAASLSLSTPF